MKAILEFDLPEEAELHQQALKAREYHLALEDVVHEFRDKARYSDEETTTWQQARELFFRVMNLHGIEL